jgi:hypothetical protein
MKKITIEGKFTGSINNSVDLVVLRPNSLPNPYDFSKNYKTDFIEILVDLQDNTTYNIDFTGFSTGTFDLTISGEFNPPNPIKDTLTEHTFSPGYVIHTNL